jgi:hypothetical protein
MKRHQNIIFYIMAEVQRDLEDVPEGIGIFFIRHIRILSGILHKSRQGQI